MQEADRFAHITSNFKLIQAANAKLEKELDEKIPEHVIRKEEKQRQEDLLDAQDPYRRWKPIKIVQRGHKTVVTNCIISPDGRTVYHAKNGRYCDCNINTDYPFVWEHINPTNFGYN